MEEVLDLSFDRLLMMMLYKLGDVAACRRAACVLCAVQSETHSALHTTHMPLYDMLPHHLIYIYNDVILPSVLT